MAKYKVRVRYAFEGTYTVAAGSCEEAKRVVEEDCGLVLGGNIHTTCNEEEVTEWNFGIHPESLILSIKETGRKARVKYTAMDFSDRIEELRNDIIEAIRQLLQAYSLTELAFTDREDDPVWIVWFGKNGDPYECRVTGVRITASSLTVIAEEKESGDEVECYGPFELGASTSTGSVKYTKPRNWNWKHPVMSNLKRAGYVFTGRKRSLQFLLLYVERLE